MTALSKTFLSVQNQSVLTEEEKGFRLLLQQQGEHNKRPITLYRFEPEAGVNLGQQYVSFMINNDTQALQGVVRLRPQYDSQQKQVSAEQATKVAKAFLQSYGTDLLANYKVNWVDKHNEEIHVEGKKVQLTGMKVKCRDLNSGLYFWTIVAPDGQVMVFERDVEWDFLRAGRKTEKWLHDDWLGVRLDSQSIAKNHN